ncbi:uncharacterized protein B0H18DRAFT_1215370 [Fomitopsis serialis]|uniref:uncharacterized protein n=1 Tax=Fomitopsis serialis TaxID=139415 RepID=UPI0020078900|nr:uncharacterized protein B0H18DRAFT_1215370 [Neoantrodia serialis]KAH9915671.1 hypothetical protein B0H18DRAFT_1215370 [Neoantrodia serialis]
MSLRRSQRLKDLKTPKAAIDAKARSETARVSEQRVQGRRRGGLKLKDMFSDMPTDIIHESRLAILTTPADVYLGYFVSSATNLLSLSRISKTFHAFLFKKSSADYWKRALKTIERAPPCPQWLIEPAFIALILFPVCMACGKKRPAPVYWAFLMRICDSCKPRLVIDQYELLDSDRICAIPRTILNLGRVTRYGRAYCLRDEAREAIHAWKTFSKDEDTEALDRYIEEKSERIKELSDFQSLCLVWLENEEALRARERDRLQKERYQFIISKLQALGFEPELQRLQQNRMTVLSNHTLVRVPELLTDRSWRTIQGELVKLMQSLRTSRLAYEAELEKKSKATARKRTLRKRT